MTGSPHPTNRPPAENSPRHAVRLDDDGFTVWHRGIAWSGFSYRWADDLRGIEFWHDRDKVGEVCTPGQIHADLRGRGLPDRVVEVATITFGILVFAIREGRQDRSDLITAELEDRGLERFAVQ